MSRIGRKAPYTNAEVARRRCRHCGAPAARQWACCANDGLWVPVCLDCDLALNRHVLDFLNVPDAERRVEAYKTRYVEEGVSRG